MFAENVLTITPNEPFLVSGKITFEISDNEFSQIRKLLLVKRGFNLDDYFNFSGFRNHPKNHWSNLLETIR